MGASGGANNTFVYCGFKPKFILIKNIDTANNWIIYDDKREGYNPDNDVLYPNGNDVEAGLGFDMLSNGFKVRGDNGKYGSGETFIYYAVGQSLVGTNNVPCTAR